MTHLLKGLCGIGVSPVLRILRPEPWTCPNLYLSSLSLPFAYRNPLHKGTHKVISTRQAMTLVELLR